MLKRMVVAAWLALATSIPVLATTVVPLDLGQIVDQSAVAFEGTCLENRSGKDPQTGLLVTFTTFRVHDVLKGDVAATYTIKQIGGESTAEHLKFKVHGVPSFTVGQRYVVFLAGVSSAGFSSPIGLSQGRFTVEEGESGRSVSNGNDFRDLTAAVADMPLPAQAKASGGTGLRKLGLDDFKRLVRGHLGAEP